MAEQHNIKAIRDKGTPFLCEAMEPDNWSPEQGRINKISATHLKDRQKSSIFEVLQTGFALLGSGRRCIASSFSYKTLPINSWCPHPSRSRRMGRVSKKRKGGDSIRKRIAK
jgi:hypothetical protein